jgi:hypothetical protein
MTPILERDNLPDGWHKFVRDGDVVAFGKPDEDHAAIAERHSLGTPTKDRVTRREVDDAGRLARKESSYKVGGKSHTTRIRGDRTRARTETIETIRRTTGREVEPSDW